jgi:hypothetical protein
VSSHQPLQTRLARRSRASTRSPPSASISCSGSARSSFGLQADGHVADLVENRVPSASLNLLAALRSVPVQAPGATLKNSAEQGLGDGRDVHPDEGRAARDEAADGTREQPAGAGFAEQHGVAVSRGAWR